ncbi:MAG: VOC family protein, partial [Deltaproteobacteria bacterium]|nr:VOC family protein [Deltaproteobacteria bacterium]
DNAQEISAQLDRNGLRLFNIVGKQVKPGEESFAIWTHPKDTHGQLEFAVIGKYTIDPRLQPAWSHNFWVEQHPLGLERASHITAVVRDLPSAKRLYCDILAGKLLHEEETADRKRSAFVAVGEDTVVELAQPLSPASPEGREMEENGEGIYSVTFAVRDLARTNAFLKSKQLRPEPDGTDSIVLSKDQAFGMVMGFTQRKLPNDPR